MNKRLAMLEKMVESGSADSFARYALGLEYKKEGRPDDAISTFRALRENDEAYVPQYLMAGTLLAELGRTEEAREWLGQGVAVARRLGNGHALGELESALAGL